MKLVRWVPVLLVLVAAPAFANDGESCQDLWFTRNLIMDRAGYCFSSPLGEALFDNSDCTGNNVRLDARAQKAVDQLKALETEIGCKVDTARTALDVPDIDVRRQLIDLPVLEEFPGMCVEWLGAGLPLRAGHAVHADVIGAIVSGKNVLFNHVAVGDWTYVTVVEPDQGPLVSAGWLHIGDAEPPCRQLLP